MTYPTVKTNFIWVFRIRTLQDVTVGAVKFRGVPVFLRPHTALSFGTGCLQLHMQMFPQENFFIRYMSSKEFYITKKKKRKKKKRRSGILL